MSGDPATVTWRETVGLSTADLRRELAEVREEFADTYADLAKARYELKQERLDHGLTKASFAASQQDLSHVERQLRDADAERLVAEARLHDALADIDALTLINTELTAAQQAEKERFCGAELGTTIRCERAEHDKGEHEAIAPEGSLVRWL